MATYQFSALADGQAISFNPGADVLNFDQTTIAAADIRATAEGSNLRISVATGSSTGKDVLLLNVSAFQLAMSNVTFANGSRLLFGDNTTGTAADNSANSLTGGAGPDHLAGFGGNDTLNGGASGDRVDGGDGNDSLVGGDGLDWLAGGSGDDTIQGLEAPDTIDGGAGNDSLLGGLGDDWFAFSAADYGRDFIDGGDGRDMLSFFESGGRSGIVVDLPAGTLTGGGTGGAGSATLASIENVRGTLFADRVTGNGDGSFEGGAGNDTLIGGTYLDGGDGNDELQGTAGDNLLVAGSGSDTLFGGGGNDTFWVSDLVEHDLIDGGEGRDNLSASAAPSTMVVDLSAGTISGGDFSGRAQTTLIGIEDFEGGASHDHITGTSAANRLSGGGKNDTIHGAGGNDTLTGGVGADRFFFGQAPGAANADLIVDFAPGADKIVLDPTAHANLGAAGDFVSGDARFAAGAGFTAGRDASDRVVYNTSTGDLYYDADGSGGGAAQLVATIAGAPALAATDLSAGTGSPSARPVYNVRTVMDHGPSDNRVDIVFVGDGYTADQLDDYSAHINSVLAYMFDDSLLTQPFGRYESFFNVHAVDVISNESGADHPGIARDTALGANYNGRLLLIDFTAASTIVADALRGTDLEAEMRFAAVNDPEYGGAGGSFAVFAAANGAAKDVALHEAAHHFADLADQYVETPGTRWTGGELANPDITSDPSGAKWARWLGYNQPGIGVIGAYEGGAHVEFGMFRPSVNSKMRSLDQPFDAVGQEAFILEFYDLVDPLDAHLANTQTLVDTDELWVDTIDPNVIQVDWTINGTTYANAGERISLSALGYSDGEFDVSARAYDPTDWVRVQDRSSLEETVQWDVVNDSSGTSGDDSLTGTSGDDTLDGGAGNDTLYGGAGNDLLIGGTGSDYFLMTFGGDYGRDTIQGGDGVDIISIGDATSGVEVNFGAGTLSGGGTGGSGSANFSSIEMFIGGSLADHILGGAAADWLHGREGNDTIAAGGGNDSLQGAAGNDSFDFSAFGAANADLVYDFVSGADKIRLDNSAHSSLGIAGNFAPGDARFWAAPGATGGHDPDDRVVYNTSNGNLYFDPDGSGTVAAQLIATLDGAPALSATDIAVIGNTSGIFLTGSNGNDSLNGTDGNDTIEGLGGNDTIYGAGGNDSLLGGDGSDQFLMTFGANYGDDTILGGAGMDMITLGDAQSSVQADLGAGTMSGGAAGGSGSATFSSIEMFVGGIFDDRISGGGAADWLHGRDGNDTISGGAGADTIYGAAGNDDLSGGDGVDVLDGGDGDDTIHGAGGNDSLIGGGGNEYFLMTFGADYGQDTIVGGDGSDMISVGDAQSGVQADLGAGTMSGGGAGGSGSATFSGIEMFLGGVFADRISGSGAADWLHGREGNDTISGGAGSDTIYGAAGNDELDGGDGVDQLDGGDGDDTYFVTAGDVLADSGGVDTVVTAVSWNISPTTIDNITLTGTAAINADGNALANLIIGNEAANVFNARAGNDTVQGNGGNDSFLMSMGGTSSFGNDSLDGGAGSDLVEFGANAQSALVADLAAGTVTGGEAGGAGSSTILNMERFIAGNFADRVTGNAAANDFLGGSGNDTLSGLGGNDTLTGGAGSDSFVFASAAGSANADRINDFALGTDQLLFENDVLTALGAPSTWAAGDGRFRAAAGATSGADANDRLIYNTSNGNLYYDPDGLGGTAGQILVTLAGAPALTAADITVI